MYFPLTGVSVEQVMCRWATLGLTMRRRWLWTGHLMLRSGQPRTPREKGTVHINGTLRVHCKWQTERETESMIHCDVKAPHNVLLSPLTLITKLNNALFACLCMNLKLNIVKHCFRLSVKIHSENFHLWSIARCFAALWKVFSDI